MTTALAVLKNQPKELVFLGEKGLCKYSDKGILQAISVEVTLSLAKNHIYAQTNGSGTNQTTSYKITSEGYERINRFANLQEVPEPTIELGGKQFPNPYVSFDKFGRKDKVYQKVTLAGRDTNGDIKISSALIISDASDMLVAELSNKLKWDKGEKLGYYSTEEEYQEDKKKTKGLKYFPIDEDYGMVINLRSEDFRKVKANVDDKRATIERKTHTIAKRNAFRKHPATSFYTVPVHEKKDVHGKTVDLYATVQVIKWVNQNDEELKKAIEDHLENFKDDEIAENYTDVDEDYDFEDGEDLPDDIVTLDEALEEYDNVSEETVNSKLNAEDTTELQALHKWIEESKDIVGADIVNELLNKHDQTSIMEMKTVKSEINKVLAEGDK